jgi:two-component system, chemotaxis family, CheB/CheR fusion protein
LRPDSIFLDRHLIIRSFTRAVTSLYNLIPTDQGRPVTDILSRLDYEGLAADVATVLETLQPLERRIARDDRSMYYIMRILPYREPDSTVSGVLVTFVDVTSIVQAEAALLEADLRKDTSSPPCRMNCAIPWRRFEMPLACESPLT